MKVVLFCGGQGLRLRDAYSDATPKPLIPVGEHPILLHLMRYYAHFGHTDFIVCLGHGAAAFKRYFLDRFEAMQSDLVLSGPDRRVEIIEPRMDDWRITLVDTGARANIGQRLMAVRSHLEGEEHFLANYGDQLSDSRLDLRIQALRRSGRVASMLGVRPQYSTHLVDVDPDTGCVAAIKPMDDGSLWINGGFFVFRQDVFDYMRPGEELVEQPFARLMAAGELVADRYEGFWAPMDTLKDKHRLDALAEEPAPPWAVWLDDAERQHVLRSGGGGGGGGERRGGEPVSALGGLSA